MHHIKGSVFRTGAPCIGKCFQDGCTPKLTGARAPGLTEPLDRAFGAIDMMKHLILKGMNKKDACV